MIDSSKSAAAGRKAGAAGPPGAGRQDQWPTHHHLHAGFWAQCLHHIAFQPHSVRSPGHWRHATEEEASFASTRHSLANCLQCFVSIAAGNFGSAARVTGHC